MDYVCARAKEVLQPWSFLVVGKIYTVNHGNHLEIG